ncbi:MAG: AlpA family phage regulatory protein [Nitrosomonas sp.]
MKNGDQNSNEIKPELLSLKEVIRRTGKSRSTLYRDFHSGKFPKPVRIGKKGVAIKMLDYEKWLNSLESIQLNGTNKEGK